MFTEHRYRVVSIIALVAGLCAHVLAPLVGVTLASPVGMLVGIFAGYNADKSTNRFRTDVERVFEPKKNEWFVLVSLLAMGSGIGFAMVMSGPLGASAGAIIGVATMFGIVKKFFNG